MLAAVTLCELGEPEMEKLFTVSVTVALCVRLPSVPVIVRVYVPAGVDEAVVTFMVEEPAPVIEDGVKEAEAPAGNPLALSATLSLKPFCAVVVIV